MINFALGEWAMLAVGAVRASACTLLGLGLIGALLGACAGMIVLGLALNRLVLRPLVGPSADLADHGDARARRARARRGGPGARRRPAPLRAAAPGRTDHCTGPGVASDKLVAAAVAIVAIALVTWFFHASRAGIALRAIADDQQVAMAMGIDLARYLALTWAVAGVIAVLAGTLWTAVAGAGLGLVLLGLKIFPIVSSAGSTAFPARSSARRARRRAREPGRRLSRSAPGRAGSTTSRRTSR